VINGGTFDARLDYIHSRYGCTAARCAAVMRVYAGICGYMREMEIARERREARGERREASGRGISVKRRARSRICMRMHARFFFLFAGSFAANGDARHRVTRTGRLAAFNVHRIHLGLESRVRECVAIF